MVQRIINSNELNDLEQNCACDEVLGPWFMHHQSLNIRILFENLNLSLSMGLRAVAINEIAWTLSHFLGLFEPRSKT
jgi:hypothetical protein